MRHRVISLYKELHRLGRDYPDPACVSRTFVILVQDDVHATAHRYNFNGRMRQLFESTLSIAGHLDSLLIAIAENKNLTNPEDIEKALKLGEYIKNGSCYDCWFKFTAI